MAAEDLATISAPDRRTPYRRLQATRGANPDRQEILRGSQSKQRATNKTRTNTHRGLHQHATERRFESVDARVRRIARVGTTEIIRLVSAVLRNLDCAPVGDK